MVTGRFSIVALSFGSKARVRRPNLEQLCATGRALCDRNAAGES
jgi:hypothetical protein